MLTLKEKFSLKEETCNALKMWQKPIEAAALSFIFCAFSLGENLHPLPLLALSCCGNALLPFSLLGTIGGIFFFLIGRNSLRYLSSVLLYAGVRFAFSDFLNKRSFKINALISALCLFITSVPFIAADFSYPLLFIHISEGVISFSSSLILHRCCEALNKKLPLNPTDLLTLGLSAALVYISAFSFKLLGLSVIKILIVSAIFAFSLHLKPSYTLSTGILFGLCSFLKGDMLFSLLLPSIALASCTFMPAGKFFALSSLLTSSFFIMLIKGIDESFIFTLAEITLGAVSAFFIPKKLLKDFFILKGEEKSEIFKNASSYRLLKTSKALDEIGRITENVSREFERLRGEPMEKHIQNAVDKACRKCKNSPTCWQRYYDRSSEEVRKLFIDGKNGLPLDMDSFRKMTGCINCNLMEDTVNEEAKKYAEFLRSKTCSQSIRFIMCDQFSGFSSLLNSIREESEEIIPLTEGESKSCEEVLKSSGCIEKGGFAGKNKSGTYALSFLFPKGHLHKISVADLTSSLSEAVKSPLSPPVAEEEEGCTRLFWRTESPYLTEFDYYQTASENKRICGDSVETSVSLWGDPLFFLSDGMGVGGDAAVDSAMTTCLLSRLLASGASFPAALKLVSASLLSIKDERLCTVDFLSPDLFKGTLTFFKAGAAPSFLLREGRCFKIGKSALPAGILGGAEAAKSVFSLKDADLVLMVSDGVTETGEDWILSSLPPLMDKPPLDICKEIIDLAKKRSLTERYDDMTAMVIKFIAKT